MVATWKLTTMDCVIFKNAFTQRIKNLCIYCTYVREEKIPAYTFHYIKELKKCGYETMVISHSQICEEDIVRLKEICCAVVVKENVGYDFFAWKKGLELCDNGTGLDNLLLTNDSIIGPFGDMKDIFAEM